MSRFEINFRIFGALLLRDLKILRSLLFDNIIDSAIVVCIVYFIYDRLLPIMGMSNSLFLPTFMGTFVIVLLNIAYDRAIIDALDFEFTKFINYQRTLPISINWLIAKYVTSYVCDLFVSSFPILIIGRIIIGSKLIIAYPFLFMLIYILSMLLMSMLLLAFAFAVDLRWFRENIWPRFLLPMVTLGALYYPLKPLVDALPWTKWFELLIPMTYVVEGFRHTIDTQAYIPEYACIVVLSVLCLMFAFVLKWAVRKRIDPL